MHPRGVLVRVAIRSSRKAGTRHQVAMRGSRLAFFFVRTRRGVMRHDLASVASLEIKVKSVPGMFFSEPLAVSYV